MKLRVLVADDHKIVRDGITALLAQESDLNAVVVATATDGRNTVAQARKVKPDLIIMDVGMPDLNGIEATRQICSNDQNVKILALSMHSDKLFVERMLQAGASGYLLKDCAFEELRRAIQEILSGNIYLSPALIGTVIRDIVHSGPKGDFVSLTAREREVLQLIAEGKTTKEIADRLGVSTKTAGTHRQRLMDKLNIHSIAELTKYAIRDGITTL